MLKKRLHSKGALAVIMMVAMCTILPIFLSGCSDDNAVYDEGHLLPEYTVEYVNEVHNKLDSKAMYSVFVGESDNAKYYSGYISGKYHGKPSVQLCILTDTKKILVYSSTETHINNKELTEKVTKETKADMANKNYGEAVSIATGIIKDTVSNSDLDSDIDGVTAIFIVIGTLVGTFVLLKIMMVIQDWMFKRRYGW